MKSPSWFIYGPEDPRLQDAPDPTIEDEHDVIVRIKYVGVCGSDVHFFLHGGIGMKVSPDKPLILGHEASGTVHSIGAAVTSVKVGDDVAIEPGVPCGRCRACKDGKYNFCPDMRFAGAPPDSHGCLTKFFRTRDDLVYKLPKGVSLQEAVLVEPAAVAVHAINLAGVKRGQDVVIMGSGTIGLLCGAVAKASGAGRVTLTDIVPGKLEDAKRILNCGTFLTDPNAPAEETAQSLLAQLDSSHGVDIVIEASGAERSTESGVFALKMGGSLVQVGIRKSNLEGLCIALTEKEVCIQGSFRYSSGDFNEALRLIAEGKIEPKALLSEVVTPFQRAPEAWERTRRSEGIKNLIEGVLDE